MDKPLTTETESAKSYEDRLSAIHAAPKKRLLDFVFGTIVAFVITAVIQFLTALLIQDKAEVVVGPSMEIANAHYISVEIRNTDNSTINGLRLRIPKSAKSEAIVSSGGLSLKAPPTSGSSAYEEIVVSDIAPRSLSRLMVPSTSVSDEDTVAVINRHELRINQTKYDRMESPASKALRTALINAGIYSVVLSLIFYYTTARLGNRIEILRSELGASNAAIKEHRSELRAYSAEAETEVKGVRRSLALMKLVMSRRIRDLESENDFWRTSLQVALRDKSRSMVKKLMAGVRKVIGVRRENANLPVTAEEIDAFEEMLKELEPMKPRRKGK